MKIKVENAKYPQNVIEEIFRTTSISEEEFFSLYELAQVTDKDKIAFEAYYKNRESLTQISKKMGVTKECVRQRIVKTLCRIYYLRCDIKKIEEYKKKSDTIAEIEYLGLSTRAYNCLKRAGIYTVEQLKQKEDEDYLIRIRALGVKTLEEIRAALKRFEQEMTR